MPAGYSGTPLARKLGLEAGQRVGVRNAPAHLETLLEGGGPLPRLLRFSPRGARYERILWFVPDQAALGRGIATVTERLDVDGRLWVCWPKKRSPLFRDLTEDGVREQAFPLDLVDVKVCAVDEDWSGLALVFRKERRAAVAAGR